MRSELEHFFSQPRRSFEQGGTDVDGAATPERAAAKRNRCGITFDETNIFRTHAPKIRRDLCKNSFMTLAVSGGAGRNNDLPGRVNANFRTFIGTHSRTLHVATDADSEIAPPFAQNLLLLTQLLVACCVQRPRQSLGKVTAVVANRFAVAIQDACTIRHLLGLNEITAPHLCRI